MALAMSAGFGTCFWGGRLGSFGGTCGCGFFGTFGVAVFGFPFPPVPFPFPSPFPFFCSFPFKGAPFPPFPFPFPYTFPPPRAAFSASFVVL